MTNAFNEFFTSIATKLLESQNIWDEYVALLPQVAGDVQLDLPNILTHFVSREVGKVSPSEATGTDGKSVRLLRTSKPAIVNHLTYILNMSLQHGTVPCCLKDARIASVFKFGEKEDVNNYCPVSILPVISKY